MSNELLINNPKSNNSEVMSNKQIEEMAKAMCINGMPNGNCVLDDDPCSLECVYGYCAERLYNAGYRKQEWISVEERLPETNKKVLVCYSNGSMDIAQYIRVDGFELWFEETTFTKHITHWMPLPEAPKMKGGGEG